MAPTPLTRQIAARIIDGVVEVAERGGHTVLHTAAQLDDVGL